MTENVGKTDRIIRVVAEIIIMALGYSYSSYWGYLGLIPIVTAAMSWCPIYAAFGANTCERLKLKS